MVNSYNYFESSKVKVFPSAFRGTTGETGSSTIDIEARLNTEANFTKRNGALTALKDSYLIDWSGNKIKCVISGYYFEIDAEGVTLKEENKNYYLKIWPVETVLDSGENKTRVLGLANNIAGNLDSEGKFKGLGYIEKPSTESYTEANSLCISKNNAVNYMALLPKEVLHGDEEHSIKIDGSLTDLTVDGDTTIGEGLVITDAKTGDVKKQIIVGQYNNKKNDNCIFEVGSGTSDSDRSDILQVTKDTVSVTNSGLLSTSNITTDVKVKSRTTDGDNKDGGHLVFAAGAASGIGDVTVGNYDGGFRAYCYKDGTVSNDNYRSLYFTKEGTLKQAIGSTVKEIINNKGEATDITLTETDTNANANVKFKVGKKSFNKTVNNVSHSTNSTTADKLTTARKLGTTTITYAEATKKSTTIDFDGSSTDAYYIPLPSDLLADSITTSTATCTDVFKASVVDNSAQIDLLDSNINFTVPELGTFLNVNIDSSVRETDLYLTGNLFIDKHPDASNGDSGDLDIVDGNLNVEKGSINLNNGQVRYGDSLHTHSASTGIQLVTTYDNHKRIEAGYNLDITDKMIIAINLDDPENINTGILINNKGTLDLFNSSLSEIETWDNGKWIFGNSTQNDFKTIWQIYELEVSWDIQPLVGIKKWDQPLNSSFLGDITKILINWQTKSVAQNIYTEYVNDITPSCFGKTKITNTYIDYNNQNENAKTGKTEMSIKAVQADGVLHGIDSRWLILQFKSPVTYLPVNGKLNRWNLDSSLKSITIYTQK